MPAKRNLPNTTAANVTVTPQADTAIATITKHVTAAFVEAAKPHATTIMAANDLDKAREAERGIREGIMVRMAALSLKHMWSADHITDAVKAAVDAWKGDNTKATTVAQFGVELRRAMHPKAREHVETAFTDAKQAFVDEAERVRDAAEGETVETPLRKAFARSYQLAAGSKGMLQAYIDDKPEAVAPEMLAAANAAEERTDTRKAAKAFDRLIGGLEALYEEFPAKELELMLRYGKAINRNKLDAAKRRGSPAITRSTSRSPAPPAPAASAEDAADALIQ